MSEREKPLEVREAEIAEEIKQRLQTDPDSVHRDFQNMWMNLIKPEGDAATSRNAYEILGMLDQKPTDKRFSELRLSQTHREFYSVVDTAISQVDPDGKITDMIKKAMNESVNKKHILPAEKAETVKALNPHLVPIYARLRALGYENADFNT